jgi:hypothetical protein
MSRRLNLKNLTPEAYKFSPINSNYQDEKGFSPSRSIFWSEIPNITDIPEEKFHKKIPLLLIDALLKNPSKKHPNDPTIFMFDDQPLLVNAPKYPQKLLKLRSNVMKFYLNNGKDFGDDVDDAIRIAKKSINNGKNVTFAFDFDKTLTKEHTGGRGYDWLPTPKSEYISPAAYYISPAAYVSFMKVRKFMKENSKKVRMCIITKCDAGESIGDPGIKVTPGEATVRKLLVEYAKEIGDKDGIKFLTRLPIFAHNYKNHVRGTSNILKDTAKKEALLDAMIQFDRLELKMKYHDDMNDILTGYSTFPEASCSRCGKKETI